MKKVVAVIMTVCVCMLVLSVLPVHGESEIYDSVFRLHVIANSDSEEDQKLKLKVRDAIIDLTCGLFCGCVTRDEAIEVAESSMGMIKETAEKVIEEEGYSYTVKVTVGEEEYPMKNYESCCFPAGTYVSLRVMIGEAAGQNWWCVLYPPLCLSAATKKDQVEEEFIEVGLTDEQYRIITESDDAKYRLRFKFLEIIEEIIP